MVENFFTPLFPLPGNGVGGSAIDWSDPVHRIDEINFDWNIKDPTAVFNHLHGGTSLPTLVKGKTSLVN